MIAILDKNDTTVEYCEDRKFIKKFNSLIGK